MELMGLVENEPTARPFQCDWQSCNKSFDKRSNLQRHYRTHTNERPYSCTTPDCDKSFTLRSSLTDHIRAAHTGEKPYQCQQIGCDSRFSRSSSLARHRRIHTGKRPYKCAHDGCLKSFCRKTTMVKHQRRSHQRGMQNGGDILDDCVSASDGGEPSSIQQQADMEWFYTPCIKAINHLGMGHAMSQATSFGNYTQHMDGYQTQQQQQQQYGTQLYSLFGGPHDFRGQPVHEQQHPAVMLQRTASFPQLLYFGTSQDIQGVATMYAQVPRQQQDQVENLYFAPGMNEFIQSSPSGFSESGPYWLI